MIDTILDIVWIMFLFSASMFILAGAVLIAVSIAEMFGWKR